MSRALKTRVEENTLECNCGMKWMTSVEVCRGAESSGHEDRHADIFTFLEALGVYGLEFMILV